MPRQTSATGRSVRRRWQRSLAALLALAGLATQDASGGVAANGTNGSAVVLMYHQIGQEERFPTSVSLEQFEVHVEALTSEAYNVLPVSEILRRLDEGPALPPRSVGLSFDDAWLSSYRLAWPRLRKAGLPFALFLASDHIDQRLPAYMGWSEVRELADSGLVEIGVQGSAHAHLTRLEPAEAGEDIEIAIARVTAELGRAPSLFSYPYGEYGLTLRNHVASLGFQAAFGQHSGAFDASDDRFALPRFAMSLSQGGLERFHLVASALPLPAKTLTPRDPLLSRANNPPVYGLLLHGEGASPESVTCYVDGKPAEVAIAGPNRIEVRPSNAFAPGRHRINCTQPGPERRWRWRGALFTVDP